MTLLTRFTSYITNVSAVKVRGMPMINDALTYPTNHDDWKGTILIGGILSLLGFLLIPLLPVYGYLIRVIRYRLDGDPQPPTFGDWEELFVDGIKAFVIMFVYFIIPGIIGAVTVGASIGTLATGGNAASGFAGFGLAFLLTIVLFLVFGYIAVAALVNFANEDQLGAGFDFTAIKAIIFTEEYALAWALSIGIFIAAWIVVGLLNVIPLLGAIIGAFVIFYVQIVAAHLWAGGFSDAREDSGVAERSAISD